MTTTPRTRRRIVETPPTLHAATGQIIVSRTIYGHASDRTDTIAVPSFPTVPARVCVEGSLTRNLGDYNSARVTVRVEMPCLPVQEEIERVYQMVSGWTDHLLGVELQNAVAASAPAR